MSRKLALAGGGALALVVLLWWVLLWGPRRGQVAEARERVAAAETRGADLEMRLARLKDLETAQAHKLAQLEALRVAVPDQPNLAQFILEANEAATRSGIEFLTVSPQQPVAGTATGPPAIAVSMSVKGGYFQVLDYLNRLDEMRRIVVIDSLNLAPDGNAARGLTVAITARMFVAPAAAPGLAAAPAAAPAAPAAPAAATTTTIPAPPTTPGAP